ncbi:UvrD-helicase domain-containing protein [Winogradskyella aurantia]|uniref:DNA 3'-5' helicase n=1 Tax=Winogradskyella aurantia TaxID=1915063 RepID=A0A265V036_9FLAO|nr:UvrD-helicase domain-containing protein [Winogradskyella aurantia]OZV70924.1 DNA helicase UvrD [Winogradskyella aurantia]
MSETTFKIFNASAGSGKTYTLTKAYLKLLFQSDNYTEFKNILAITFTNKAVGEMKARIILMLKVFSTHDLGEEIHPMMIAICEELSVTEEFLKTKSSHILKHIVHNYGAFEISTIDGFTHRVIRTFAHDLHLPVNFEVELDQDRLLTEAVDALIAKAGTDKTLTDTLVDFAIEKTDDDKSWDISYDFNKIAKLLVNENDIIELEKLEGKSLEDFKDLKKDVYKRIKSIETAIINSSSEILTLIEESGLQFDDFSRKSLPNHFLNLKNGRTDLSFESNWQTDLIEGQPLYPKRVSDYIVSTIESLQPQLAESFNYTKSLVLDLKFLKSIYRNITPLSVLNAIQNELNQIKNQQNKILISEFNQIISKEIKDQPTPFIYERLGEKFRHYFIDEFQDTSKMQWENLVPLLDNAISGPNGSAMLVGDAKQAIYRWRGGDPEQFIELYNKNNNPFFVEAVVENLDTNYRSAKAIVEFNNSFFKFLGETFFENRDYAELYESAPQHSNLKSPGYVDLTFLGIKKEDDTTELYVNAVLETIKQCQANGYDLSDICVITRKRKEGVAIAEYLSDNGINITSSETLLLKNSEKVSALHSTLKLLLQPQNDILKIEVLSFIANIQGIEDKHAFYEIHLKKDLNAFFKSLNRIDIHFNGDLLLQMPLYELVEYLIRAFKLENTSDAFLQFYLDTVLEFTQTQNSDISAFVSYFEEQQDKLSVVLPDHLNAVQIMTIHKSKGLEFPIVIFPFADLDIYKELSPKVWFPVDKNVYNTFESLLLNYNKDVEHFKEIGKQIYMEHTSQLQLDNINLLYVVLTRAVEQLYIISKKDLDSKGLPNSKTFSGLFISYLQHKGSWLDSELHYSFGEMPIKKEESEALEARQLKLISTPKESHNLSIITKSGLLWDTQQEQAIEKGNLIHLILSKIKSEDDIGFAFEELISSGDLNAQTLESTQRVVKELIRHPELTHYFNTTYEVYNERDIITKTGEILRPDRLNIDAQNNVVIIDYKTGEKQAHHKSQINAYQTVLEAMNLTITKKLLIYINEPIEVIEV